MCTLMCVRERARVCVCVYVCVCNVHVIMNMFRKVTQEWC